MKPNAFNVEYFKCTVLSITCISLYILDIQVPCSNYLKFDMCIFIERFIRWDCGQIDCDFKPHCYHWGISCTLECITSIRIQVFDEIPNFGY